VLKESLGKGLGVFADRDISKGQYVTAYPAHAIWHVIRQLDDGRCEMERVAGRWIDCNAEDTRTYGVVIGEYVAVGNPKWLSPKVLGHMINDAARSHNPQDELLYSMISQKRENVRPEAFADKDMKPKVVYMRATCDIKKGEELYFSYGEPYWRFKW